MDLRDMLNGPAPSTQTKPPQRTPQTPSTPVTHQQFFHEYSQSSQASPGRPVSQGYGAPQRTDNLFGSPTSYHTPAPGPTPYGSRPQPPTLQQIPPNDLRSPSIAAGPPPAPSPYRHTPTTSLSGPSGGYPFPGPGQTPTSPVQLHHYPPQNVYHRDSYPQPPGPAGVTGSAGGASYIQGPAMPQTPPVGTPGSAHPYLQRSQSTHSTPTPTSAHSQGHYGVPYVQGSPVAATHALPPHDPRQRQQSQPPTPLGPPLSASRQSSAIYAQPPSPYQHRLSSAGPFTHPQSTHASPLQQSPAPPPPPSLPHSASVQSAYEPQSAIDPHRRSQSQSERDKSLSVSPKTRIPSLPSSTGQPMEYQPTQLQISAMAMNTDTRRRDRAATPAKRKLEDRDLQPEELENRDVRPAPFDKVNGNHAPSTVPAPTADASVSPVIPKKRRIRHKATPVWAQLFLKNSKLKAANFILHKPVLDHLAEINGKAEVKQESSRHTSPEEKRAIPASSHQASPPVAPEPPKVPNSGKPLGPWESTITGVPPMQEMVRAVADFLYLNIVANERRGEIESHGIEFEVEAKLGTLIDRSTNGRIALPVTTECVLAPNETAFRSSMTEAQHMRYNEFLNEAVKLAFPKNKANAAKPRVPVDYKHRREIDRFFELPHQMRHQLPPYIESLINPRHGVKVRVTHDEKTKEVLAKIIKARVADLDIYLPRNLLDIRISINLEMTWDVSVEDLESIATNKRKDSPDRNKDRLSYQHGPYQIDLTQVKSLPTAGHQPNPKDADREHELEIELSVPALLDQAGRLQTGHDNQFTDLVEGFLANGILLSRKAAEFNS